MSIKIPKSLDDWTYDIIEGLINKKITENYDFDFKLDLPHTDVLTDLCCSFANTDGGFIVFGIKEENNRFSIRGLDYDKEYTNRFGDRLRSEPRIKFHIKNLEIPKGKPESGKYLYVFHIPKSNQKPYVHNDPEKRKFWKRSNGKKELMTLEEIKECFQRELKEENNMLNKTIREDHKFEQERRNRHKRYYIRRISSYYDRVLKNYSKLKADIFFLDIPDVEDILNEIREKIFHLKECQQ